MAYRAELFHTLIADLNRSDLNDLRPPSGCTEAEPLLPDRVGCELPGSRIVGAGTPLNMSHPDVHIGQDGWLFLVGGRNRAVNLYRRNPFIWSRLRRWRRRIEERAARCERLGIAFVQTVAPEKLTILSHRAAEPLVDVALSPAVRLSALMARSPARSRYIDLVAPLRSAAEREDVYLRTDSHWNYQGCFIAYRWICQALRVAPREDLAERPFQVLEQALDLGNKLTPQRTEPFRLYAIMRDSRRTYVNDLVTAFNDGGGTGAVTATHAIYANHSSTSDCRRVLIFGDSYAHFDPVQLTAMFAETFREVYFVWSTSVDWGFVEEVRPDILICELAERYLRVVASDRFHLRATVAARLS
jgi:alginate O-acetyltransferase complex protein AlgJ